MTHDHLLPDVLRVLELVIRDKSASLNVITECEMVGIRLQAFMDDVPEGLETALEGEYSMQNLSIIRSAAALLASGMINPP